MFFDFSDCFLSTWEMNKTIILIFPSLYLSSFSSSSCCHLFQYMPLLSLAFLFSTSLLSASASSSLPCFFLWWIQFTSLLVKIIDLCLLLCDSVLHSAVETGCLFSHHCFGKLSCLLVLQKR